MIAIYNKKEIKELRERVSRLESLLTVRNYFADCPCCDSGELIPKHEAVEFERYRDDFFMPGIVSYYTTKQSYDIHKNVIENWAKNAKKKS